MSEGDPEDWAAVAWVVSGHVRELGGRQREFVVHSHAEEAASAAAFIGRYIGSRACK